MQINLMHRGFSMLESMAVICVGVMAAGYGTNRYADYIKEKSWSVAATHAVEFNNAAKEYILDNTDSIVNGKLPLRITPSFLVSKGYLSKDFSPVNGFDQSYVTGVVKNKRNRLMALTCSTGGDTISHKGLQSIASNIQGMGGYINEKNSAVGAFGGWGSRPSDFGIDCKNGHVAIALSSETLGTSSSESDRLYRFKTPGHPDFNRMHTDIDMGGNAIVNSNKIEAKDGDFSNSITANGNIESKNGWLVTKGNKGWMNEDHGGGFYMSDNDWIRAANDKSIYTGGQIKAGGRLSTGEYLLLGKIATAGSACSTNGLVGRDSDGGILTCQSGVWSTITSGMGFKAPKPQTISCLDPQGTMTVYARIDKDGQLWSSFSVEPIIPLQPWVKGVITPRNFYDAPRIFIDIGGLYLLQSVRTCGGGSGSAHGAGRRCQSSMHIAFKSWNW